MLWKARRISVVVGLVMYAGTSSAQDVPRQQVLLGVSLLALQTSHPQGGPPGLGGSLGVARRVSSYASVRAILGVTGVIRLDDDIGGCVLQPNGSCLPDPVFPKWLTSAELQAALAPVPRFPLSLVVGVGVVRSDGAAKRDREPLPVVADSKTRGLWKAGLELSLGRSHNAPRVQLLRTGFSSSIHSATFVDALVLSLWPSVK